MVVVLVVVVIHFSGHFNVVVVVVVMVVNMNKASGVPLFIEKNKQFSDGFITNDCIYIELEVE